MLDKQDSKKTDWIRQGNYNAIAVIVRTVLTVGSVVGVQAFASSDTYNIWRSPPGVFSAAMICLGWYPDLRVMICPVQT